LGYAGGANLGAKYAQGELLVFLNNDVRLSKDWLGNLIAAADLEDRAAIVGSKIFLENRPGILNHAGGLISYIGAGFDIGLGMPDTTPSDTFNVGYASGAALMIPRKLFEELRGFDESYFLYCEDVDLCWRAWMRGHRVVVQPSATLFHSFDNMRSQSHYWLRFFHWHKNSMTNILKNFEISLLFRGLVLHLVLQVARVVSSIRWSSPWRIITLIRADAWVAKNLRSIIAKRASIQASRKLRDRDLIRMGVFSSARETGIRGRRMFAFRFT
jgi:GT2 family glycosyltransferase